MNESQIEMAAERIAGVVADRLCGARGATAGEDVEDDALAALFLQALREAAAERGQQISTVPFPAGMEMIVQVQDPLTDPEVRIIDRCLAALNGLNRDAAIRAVEYLAARCEGSSCAAP